MYILLGTKEFNKFYQKMDTKVPELLENRTKKRKADDLEEVENSNSDHSESSSQTKNHSGYTTLSDDEENTDSRILKSPLSREDEGNHSACKWNYTDLKLVHIFFEETSASLEEFTKEVKDAFMNVKGFCPDPSKMTNTLKKHLENLAFSYDMTDLRNDRMYSKPQLEVQIIKKEMKNYLQKWSKNSEEMLDKNQFYEAFDSSSKKSAQKLICVMDMAVQTFAAETMQLVRKVLLGNPLSSVGEKERYSEEKHEKKRGKKRGGRARGRYGGSLGHGEGRGCLHAYVSGNFFQNYCDIFGRMFFLVKGEVLQGSFSFGNQTVRNRPDLVYHYLSDNEVDDELFFVMEAKKAAVSHESATEIEELVGQNNMGQVGTQLFGQSPHSIFYPNSLGVICIETKLIFVYLKLSLKHSKSIRKGDRGSADDPGKIIYTKPFDMLKAEDRSQMADFMFWLGFVQDIRKFDFL